MDGRQTAILAHVYSVSRSDDLLGGMWAVVATAFISQTALAGRRQEASTQP